MYNDHVEINILLLLLLLLYHILYLWSAIMLKLPIPMKSILCKQLLKVLPDENQKGQHRLGCDENVKYCD